MRLSLTIACGFAAMVLSLAPAHAFTFENPPTTQPNSKSPGAAGYMDMDAKGIMPPMGETLPSLRYNDGPGAYSNGMASPPDPRGSVGPSWLYGPR